MIVVVTCGRCSVSRFARGLFEELTPVPCPQYRSTSRYSLLARVWKKGLDFNRITADDGILFC